MQFLGRFRQRLASAALVLVSARHGEDGSGGQDIRRSAAAAGQ